eukprot:scaffold1244_cov18-Phaeocystis_antarctica.AAC.1
MGSACTKQGYLLKHGRRPSRSKGRLLSATTAPHRPAPERSPGRPGAPGGAVSSHSPPESTPKMRSLHSTNRRLASWKRRCFCLCASELFYYYTAEMSNPFQPLGVISLKPEPLDEPEPPSPPFGEGGSGGGGADMRGATVSA